jgi:hypothetical protein
MCSPRCRCNRLPRAPNPPPFAVDRCFLRIFAVPVARSAIRLGHVRPHLQFGQPHHHIIAVIALIGDQLLHAFRIDSILSFGRLLSVQVRYRKAGLDHGLNDRDVTSRSAVRSHGNDGAGFHVHSVLRFVGQCRAPVFHLHDLGAPSTGLCQSSLQDFFLRLRVHAEQC